jgi:amino acid permease
MQALAAEGKAPRVFLRCNRWGTPYVALTLCTAACGLAYLSVSTDTKVRLSLCPPDLVLNDFLRTRFSH